MSMTMKAVTREGHCWLLATLWLVLAINPSSGAAQGTGPDARLSFTDRDHLQIPVNGRITGLTWIGTETLAVLTDSSDPDEGSGSGRVRLILQNRNGRVLRSEDFSGVLARALAWDGEFLWSCGDADDGSSIIYKIQPDTLTVRDAFNTAGHRPTAMCFDGRFLWITDRDSGRVDRFDPEVNEITRSALTPGFSPCGIAWDGRNMWLSDSGTGQMYRLSGSRRTWSGTVDSASFMFRGRDVLLLHDGNSLWYLPVGDKRATRVRFN